MFSDKHPEVFDRLWSMYHGNPDHELEAQLEDKNSIAYRIACEVDGLIRRIEFLFAGAVDNELRELLADSTSLASYILRKIQEEIPDSENDDEIPDLGTDSELLEEIEALVDARASGDILKEVQIRLSLSRRLREKDMTGSIDALIVAYERVLEHFGGSH